MSKGPDGQGIIRIANVVVECRRCRRQGSFEEVERHACPAIYETARKAGKAR